MSSKVKQANFRLPLEYMDLIDEISKSQGITKAAVITKALDSLKASLEDGGQSEASEKELKELQNKLAQAESKAEEASRRAASAEKARDAAEAKAREAAYELSAASSSGSADAELRRLQDVVARQDKQMQERAAASAAEIAERDAKISALSEQLGAANAKAELALKNINVEAVPIGDPAVGEDDPNRALAMLNMIGGVMNAFQQQVDDARIIGEQEGRQAVQRELQDMVEKARNDGYRDAMGYLDDRVTTARDSGAREERARIANMTFFERRRYLRMHIA